MNTKINLEVIEQPIEKELKEFSGYFKSAMKSHVAIVDLIARYIVKQKGKKIRPVLVFLSAKATGGITERSFRAATLVEILHTATLIHDDVVDDADTRRGLASINAVWKNKVAVLMGDFLLSRGLLVALTHDDFYFLKTTSYAVKRMSEGELLQIQKSRSMDLEEKTYLQIIGDKTASLLSTCCEIGAHSSGADTTLVHAMREYGENIGMAFQIRDDVLDYIGRKSITGKPTGLDIKEKKLSLPLIHAIQQSQKNEGKRIVRLIKNGASTKEIQSVIDFVQTHGGIEYAMQCARQFGKHAREALASLPPSDAKKSLDAFIDFVIERKK
ncbi:MAG: polyprenyl synthetase family protein [Bacteroidota bacterium]